MHVTARPAERLMPSTGHTLRAGLLLLAVCLCAGQAVAQPAPMLGGATAGAQAAAAEAAAAAAAAPAPVATTILLREVRFGPSAHLDAAALQAAVRPFVGRRLDARGLSQLVAAVNALYSARVIGLAEAGIEALDARAGVVRVALYEARLGVLGIEQPDLSGAYVAWRLGLRPGAVVDTRSLEAGLARLSLSDDILIAAEFRAGTGPGLVDLALTAQGAPARRGVVSLDNFGKRSTGRARLSLGYSFRSLTGRNDPLSLSLTLLERGGSGSVAYARTVTPSGTRLNIGLDASDMRTLAAPVTRTRSFGGEIGLSHPLILSETTRLTASLSVLGFREVGSVAGAPFLEQTGQGLRLGLSAFRNGEGWFVSAGTSLAVVRWSDVIAGTPARTHVATSFTLAGAARLSPGLVASAQAAGQLATSAPAPSRMRFAAAGPNATRGYDADAASGDSGFYIRAQIEAAESFRLGEGLTVRPFLFVDAGRAYTLGAGGLVAQAPLASVGLGASLRIGSNITGDVFVARPMLRAPGTPASGEWVIYVGLGTSF